MRLFSRLIAVTLNGDHTREVFIIFSMFLSRVGHGFNTRPVVVENAFATVRAKSAVHLSGAENLESIDGRIFMLGM